MTIEHSVVHDEKRQLREYETHMDILKPRRAERKEEL